MKKYFLLPALLILCSSAFSQTHALLNSAREGNTKSQVELATFLLTPGNKNFNPAVASEWLEIAMSRGNLDAQFVLGEALLFGMKTFETPANQILKQDRPRGLRLIHEAADAGNDQALNKLGVLYYNGSMVKKDIRRSEEYFKKAIKMGSSLASKNYDYLFVRNNPYNVTEDFSPRK